MKRNEDINSLTTSLSLRVYVYVISKHNLQSQKLYFLKFISTIKIINIFFNRILIIGMLSSFRIRILVSLNGKLYNK